jgi:SAM-dependent methyltransferase
MDERELGRNEDPEASQGDLVPRKDASPTLDTLRRALADLERELARAVAEPIPPDEPSLRTGSRLRRSIKRKEFRLLRPISRRYDRLANELAGLARGLADELAVGMTRIGVLERAIARLGGVAASSGVTAPQLETRIEDDYYWSYEFQMRGDSPLIEERLWQYEALAVGLLEAIGREPAPLWIDLGCGRGEFLAILQEWGWRVLGVDTSAQAVRRCRDRDLEATLGDGMDFLASYKGELPAAISGIQLIEHLPKAGWIDFLRSAFGLLRPGGAILLETVNTQNFRALSDSFFADVTHTWPAHPQTARLMAEHVGFHPVELIFVNHDSTGNAMDFAIWGRKPSRASG